MGQVVRGKAVAVEGVVLVAIRPLLEGGEAEQSGRRIILALSRRSCPAAVHRIVPHVLARTAFLYQGPGAARCFPAGLANGRSSLGLRRSVLGQGGRVRNNRFRG